MKWLFGLTIKKEDFELFKKAINEYAEEVMDKDKVPTIKVDAEINSNMLSLEKFNELEALEPYGEANPMPMFIYKNVKVEGIRLLSNDRHLKLMLKDNGIIFDAIAFNMGEKQYSFKVGDKIDVLHYLDVNKFNNIEKIQLNIKDIKRSL